MRGAQTTITKTINQQLEKARYSGAPPDLKCVVVAINSSGTSGNDGGDSVGIVVAGIGSDNLGYVLADETVKASPASQPVFYAPAKPAGVGESK